MGYESGKSFNYGNSVEGFAGGYTGAYPGYTGPGIPDITRVRNPRQPDTNNYLSSNYFKLEITRLPTVTYFCQSASLPSLTLTPVEQPTALGIRQKWIGGAYSYEDLSVSFVVDENLKNWLEVYEWMESIGNLTDNETAIAGYQNDDFFSDITLMITNSAYAPKHYVQFKNAFPIALSGIQFESTASESEPVIANATFTYTSYKIKDVGS